MSAQTPFAVLVGLSFAMGLFSVALARIVLPLVPSIAELGTRLIVGGITIITLVVVFGESLLLLRTFGGASIVFPMVAVLVLLTIVLPIPLVTRRIEELGPVRAVACGLAVTVALLMLAFVYFAVANFLGFQFRVKLHPLYRF